MGEVLSEYYWLRLRTRWLATTTEPEELHVGEVSEHGASLRSVLNDWARIFLPNNRGIQAGRVPQDAIAPIISPADPNVILSGVCRAGPPPDFQFGARRLNADQEGAIIPIFVLIIGYAPDFCDTISEQTS